MGGLQTKTRLLISPMRPQRRRTSFLAILPPGVHEVTCLAREGTCDVRMVHYDEGMYAVRTSVGQ